MKYFPQIVVPLLLFLIAMLLGAILWLQYTRTPQEISDDRPRRERYIPWDPINTPDDDANDRQNDGDQDDPEGKGRRENSGIVEVDPIITRDPARTPPENELKPDLNAIETAEAKALREKAEAQARLEAVLARGAILEQAQDGKNLNARVLWIVPKHEQLGTVTPEDMQGYYCGQLKGHPSGKILKQTADSLASRPDTEEVLSGIEKRWLLVGRVVPEVSTTALDAAWNDLTRPPTVVEGLGYTVVANKQGWFAIDFKLEVWDKNYRNGLRVRSPGWRIVTGDKSPANPADLKFELERNPADQKPVTVAITPAAPLILQLTVKPGVALKLPMRAWLEVFSQPKSYRPNLNEPGLFIEADIPTNGVLSFVFPDPRTFCTAKPRYAACGEGWSSGTPQVLEEWDRTAGDKRKEPARYLMVKELLELQPASTELIQGVCLADRDQPELSPVRIESKQTGALTWTLAGAFGLWAELTRGNWQQKLIVDPLYTTAFEFCVDYDAERPKNVTLAEGASAPLGPWRIRLPQRDTAPRYIYLEGESNVESLQVDVAGTTTRLKFEVVEGAPGFIFVAEYPFWGRNVAVRDSQGAYFADLSLVKSPVHLIADEIRRKDPWGNPFPVYALKRK